ncbi:MAG: hypothetical protein J5I93_18720 [Pirellulaceae bacterium]|nr:hypothetical protein [Pirellulaceae bacterium]
MTTDEVLAMVNSRLEYYRHQIIASGGRDLSEIDDQSVVRYLIFIARLPSWH